MKTNFVTELGSDVVDLIYPVGSYYVSNSSTSPATLFSWTTWTQITNKFLYCAESGAGDTGGSSTHTHATRDHILTTDQIPSHSHPLNSTERVVFWDTSGTSYTNIAFREGTGNVSAFYINGGNQGTQNRGGGQAHNHGNTESASSLPPYVKVYCWQRTK